jgi:LacI family transcriptional regulator
VLGAHHIKNKSIPSMPHHFLIKDIAFQAGLGTATVDRVLHGRDHVRAQTRLRVEVAIEELTRQEQLRLKGGRNLAIDIVMEAPDRFSREVRNAFESEAAAFHPLVFRPRFQLSERIEPDVFAHHLDRIRSRGSDGVIVKGPDVPAVREAVNRLTGARIPVITLVTDLTATARLAYAGIDNEAAGETAAWLMSKILRESNGTILATLSSNSFRGEEDRVNAFASAVETHTPGLAVVRISEGFGRDESTGLLAARALRRNGSICAVYSAGGGNRAVLKAFSQEGRACRVFVAHDLDPDNRELLSGGQIDFVLHHDLASDARAIYAVLSDPARSTKQMLQSRMTIHTPFNTI